MSEKILQLNTYSDWLAKARYDIDRFKKTKHIYDLVDCLLTLNAIPEWMACDVECTCSKGIRQAARQKIRIMKGWDNFELDQKLLKENIDHKIRFIRLYCNQNKHGKDKSVPQIVKSGGMAIPTPVPASLEFFIKIGTVKYRADLLAEDVLQYWEGLASDEERNIA